MLHNRWKYKVDDNVHAKVIMSKEISILLKFTKHAYTDTVGINKEYNYDNLHDLFSFYL
jgi:hypothetical protein